MKPIARCRITVYLLLLAVIGTRNLLLLSQTPLTPETCHKLQLGWSLENVKAVLGDPTEYYSGTPGCPIPQTAIWRDEVGNEIVTTFDRRGLTERAFSPSDLCFFDRLRYGIESRFRAVLPGK